MNVRGHAFVKRPNFDTMPGLSKRGGLCSICDSPLNNRHGQAAARHRPSRITPFSVL
jgi:hypothetical protein